MGLDAKEERTRPDDVLRLTVLDAEALVDEMGSGTGS